MRKSLPYKQSFVNSAELHNDSKQKHQDRSTKKLRSKIKSGKLSMQHFDVDYPHYSNENSFVKITQTMQDHPLTISDIKQLIKQEVQKQILKDRQQNLQLISRLKDEHHHLEEFRRHSSAFIRNQQEKMKDQIQQTIDCKIQELKDINKQSYMMLMEENMNLIKYVIEQSNKKYQKESQKIERQLQELRNQFKEFQLKQIPNKLKKYSVQSQAQQKAQQLNSIPERLREMQKQIYSLKNNVNLLNDNYKKDIGSNRLLSELIKDSSRQLRNYLPTLQNYAPQKSTSSRVKVDLTPTNLNAYFQDFEKQIQTKLVDMTEVYNVNFKQLDKQHKQACSLINQIFTFIRSVNTKIGDCTKIESTVQNIILKKYGNIQYQCSMQKRELTDLKQKQYKIQKELKKCLKKWSQQENRRPLQNLYKVDLSSETEKQNYHRGIKPEHFSSDQNSNIKF